MFYLSELLGTAVYDAAGKRVGRVSDVSVHTGTLPPRVASLTIRSRRGKARRAIGWDDITTLDTGRILARNRRPHRNGPGQ